MPNTKGNTTKKTSNVKAATVTDAPNEKIETIDHVDNTDIEDLKRQNKYLEGKIETLMQMLMDAQSSNKGVAPVSDKDTDITIVHLIQCFDGLKTHIELTNRKIDMSIIGETRTLTYSEAEEIASKYRKFFERGILAFDSKDADFAKRFDLTSCVSNGKVNRDFVEYVGNISVIELEKLYGGLGEAQRAFLIETFKRKIAEGDPRYKDIAKIQLLERLTLLPGELNGAMEGTLMDLRKSKSI